jgi:hypothetical protein
MLCRTRTTQLGGTALRADSRRAAPPSGSSTLGELCPELVHGACERNIYTATSVTERSELDLDTTGSRWTNRR